LVFHNHYGLTGYWVGKKQQYLCRRWAGFGWVWVIPVFMMASGSHPCRVFMSGEYNIIGPLTRLSHAPDNARPPENFSCGFSYSPGSRRFQLDCASDDNGDRILKVARTIATWPVQKRY
jgi:hypothetical protein